MRGRGSCVFWIEKSINAITAAGRSFVQNSLFVRCFGLFSLSVSLFSAVDYCHAWLTIVFFRLVFVCCLFCHPDRDHHCHLRQQQLSPVLAPTTTESTTSVVSADQSSNGTNIAQDTPSTSTMVLTKQRLSTHDQQQQQLIQNHLQQQQHQRLQQLYGRGSWMISAFPATTAEPDSTVERTASSHDVSGNNNIHSFAKMPT